MNLSGTFTYETPASIPIQSGVDSTLNGFTSSGVFDNPGGIAGVGSGYTPLTNSAGQVVGYLANNPNAQYVRAAAGTFPTGSTVPFGFRPINNFDASFVKRFSVFDRFNLEFRADAFNVLNHPQFTPGSINSIGLPMTSYLSPLIPGTMSFANVGEAFSNNPRMLQLGLRVQF